MDMTCGGVDVPGRAGHKQKRGQRHTSRGACNNKIIEEEEEEEEASINQ